MKVHLQVLPPTTQHSGQALCGTALYREDRRATLLNAGDVTCKRCLKKLQDVADRCRK